jgi:hypothetical protein
MGPTDRVSRRLRNKCVSLRIDTESSSETPLYLNVLQWIMLENSVTVYVLLYVHPLLGNGLANTFPRRQILGEQSVARSSNNRTNVHSSLLGNNQSANGLAR